ncbi:nuclear transport factor 2 family protein [Marinicella sp. W31]|uniref:nuclear transport factor 2 family protein n=1 Tax=Marinicella sp. W31 TaxID=3023713 RepID=UPI00375700CE
MRSAFNGLIEASLSLKLEPYLEFFNKETFSSLNQDGTVYHNLNNFSESYATAISSIARYESLEFDNVKISVIDHNAAILVNQFEAVVILNNGDKVTARGAGTQVWKKNNTQWKLMHVSSSSYQEN